MNIAILTGRLTREPEVREYESGAFVARYTLAVDSRSKEEKTDFINCVCFNKTAKFVRDYLHKGVKVNVSGRIHTDHYTKDDGTNVKTFEIVVNTHEFCESRKEQEPKEEENEQFYTPDVEVDEEELPF